MACIAGYWCWMGYWLRNDRCANRDISQWWFYCEVAIANLLHGAGWGYLLPDIIRIVE